MSQGAEPGREERLAEVFAALADGSRLRILGRLAERSLTGRELSEALTLTAPTISHHMTKLTRAGLVTVTADGNRRLYRLDESTLASLGREVTRDRLDAAPDNASDSGPERVERARVLRGFFDGERLKQIPAQRKKRVIVLQHLMERFQSGREYPEKEINDLLRTAHEDVATLRRELVDYGYMTRAGGIYRIAGSLPERSATVAQEIPAGEHAWLESLVAGATARALSGDTSFRERRVES